MQKECAPGPCFREGLAAGLTLAVADGLAAGPLRMPLTLWAATMGLGFLTGAITGAAGALHRRPGLAAGLVVASAVALEGLSVVSKELPGSRTRALGALLVVAIGLLILTFARSRQESTSRHTWSWLLLASVPAGSLLGWQLAPWPWARIATGAAPLVVLGLERHLARARRGPVLAAILAPLLLGLPATLGEREPPRRPLPPASAAGAHDEADRPSIVLLVIDTLRADALDPLGSLVSLAAEGAEFRQAVSAAPWTLPSVSSLLTGLYPSQHGALSASNLLPDDVSTLAEILRANGYATAAFTGGAFVGSAHRLDQGFESFDPRCERRFAQFRVHTPLVWRLAKNRYAPLRWLVRWVDEYRGLEGELAALRTWHERSRSTSDGRPLFLFLHTYQVHDYYLYDPDVDDPVLARTSPSGHFSGRLSVDPTELLDAAQEDLDHFRALYKGRVRAVERLFPELRRAVEELVGPDAIWIVTADHGEGFDAARHRVHHGGRLHDDLLRVPLIVRAPGRIAAGRVIDEQVRTVDVLPSVLELVGIEVPPGLAGESLLPALRGERPFPASAFAEEREHGYGLSALRRGGWKLITSPGGRELYHVADDPLEERPLDAAPVELGLELELFPERYPPRPTEETRLDPETLEHLRALGYAQ